MGRVPQKKAKKGSQKWLQILIKEKPRLLDDRIKSVINFYDDEKIVWKSPREDDEYAEYSDKAFLDLLGLKLYKKPLKEFWPTRGGPRWDGLGKTSSGKILLVEAKSHKSEIRSPGTKAKSPSLERIQESLSNVKEKLEAKSETDWSKKYYQYTNRLAHLYLFRCLNDLPTFLVFIYFINDDEKRGPKNEKQWHEAIQTLHSNIGVKQKHKLHKYINEIFIDVKKLL